jgi:hypothetical protein
MSDPAACQAFRLALSAEFDGEAPAAGAASAYDPAHATNCPACRAFRHDLERLRRPLREARDQPLPGPLRERLRQIAFAGPRRRPHDSPQTATIDHAPGGWFAALAGRPLLAIGGGALLLVGLMVIAFGSGHPDQMPGLAGIQLRQAELHHEVLTIQAGGEATLTTPGGRSLRLWGGPGRLTFTDFTDTVVDLRQDSGKLCAQWTSRPPIPFRLQAGACRIDITGTIWRLAFEPAGESTLEVAEGQVTLVTPHGRHAVPALRRVRFSPTGAVTASEAFNPFDDPQFKLAPDQVFVNH